MNNHTVHRHIEALALHQQIAKEDRRFFISHHPRVFVTGLCSLLSPQPLASAMEKRMINLTASPKGDQFHPISRRNIKDFIMTVVWRLFEERQHPGLRPIYE